MLGADHKLPDKGEAIAMLEEMAAMQKDDYDLGMLPTRHNLRRHLRIKRQLALSELGDGGSGRVIAIMNEKDEVITL
jgi:hypothetical protein